MPYHSFVRENSRSGAFGFSPYKPCTQCWVTNVGDLGPQCRFGYNNLFLGNNCSSGFLYVLDREGCWLCCKSTLQLQTVLNEWSCEAVPFLAKAHTMCWTELPPNNLDINGKSNEKLSCDLTCSVGCPWNSLSIHNLINFPSHLASHTTYVQNKITLAPAAFGVKPLLVSFPVLRS